MAFDAKYFNWNQKKIKGILDIYNPKNLKSKKILDLGCGYADIGGALYRYGADVTTLDINQDYLKIVSKRYPGIKIVRSDLNSTWAFDNKKFDVTLHLDLLHVISDYQEHLKKVCAASESLILECPVYDCEGEKVFTLLDSASKTKFYIPTASAIEKTLIDCGMDIQRIDDKKYNSSNYTYDWIPKNNCVCDLNHRRLWFCKKNKNIIIRQQRPSLIDSSIPAVNNKSCITKKNNFSESTNVEQLLEPKNEDALQTNKLTTVVSLKENVEIKSDNNVFLASVIIPAFKAQNFIGDCLQSIINSIKNYQVEILVGVDSCTDTLNWFKDKQFKNLRVFWFNNNVGPYVIKNTLSDFANSENILFFDADDIMSVSMIEDFLKNIKFSPLIKFKYCDFNHNTGINKPLPNTWFGEGVFGIKKSIFNKLNGFEGWRCAADTEFQLRARNNKIPSKNVSNLSFYRRLHDNNLTTNKNTRYGSNIRQNYIKIINDKTKQNKWSINKKQTAEADYINVDSFKQFENNMDYNSMPTAEPAIKSILELFNSKYYVNKKVLISSNEALSLGSYINKLGGDSTILDIKNNLILDKHFTKINFNILLKNSTIYDCALVDNFDDPLIQGAIKNIYSKCSDVVVLSKNDNAEKLLKNNKIDFIKISDLNEDKLFFCSRRKNTLLGLNKKMLAAESAVAEVEVVNEIVPIETMPSPLNTIKVYHCIPWSTAKNLGQSYNEFVSLLQDDDWACFLDGDAIHTTTFFGKNIESIIQANPEYGLFTCYTNRIGNKYQIPPSVNWSNDSQKYHREWGEKLWLQHKTKVLDITNQAPLSGVLILINKNTWSQVGGFKEDKMLSIDNDIHLRFKNAGFKVGLMQGVYVQHWYRNGIQKDKSHLL